MAAQQAGSTSLQSVTAEESNARLTALISGTCRAAGTEPRRCRGVVAAHGAASTSGTCERFFAILKASLQQAGVNCPLLLTNDLVPLLLAGEPAPVAVAVAGTGTGFAACSADGTWARASGCEYLLSDEGGGFHIGMSGLRAAVRAIDGRGAPTALLGLAQRWCGEAREDTIEGLFRKVYQPDFKPVLASFAAHVLAAAADDAVAAAIVTASAAELATGIWAVVQAAGCAAADTQVLLSGSLLTRHEILAGKLRDQLSGRIGKDNISVMTYGRLIAGLRQLRAAWWSHDRIIQRLACAFPVRADVPSR
jgi:N-acetylglucosamine kinase-like BadF-type ATPase